MARPERVFLTIAATAAFVSALVFTIAPLYRFQTARLDNLQLVLVGSVMEAAVFVFEIPTGIVAVRRRPHRAGGVGPRLHVHERGHRGVARRRAR